MTGSIGTAFLPATGNNVSFCLLAKQQASVRAQLTCFYYCLQTVQLVPSQAIRLQHGVLPNTCNQAQTEIDWAWNENDISKAQAEGHTAVPFCEDVSYFRS